MTWTELETSTYQHHVIQHVIGATVLGWFIAEDAVHFVLDVGLLWTVYVNAEMNLMALLVAIEDLENEELPKAVIDELTTDAQTLIDQGREASGLKRFTAASVVCLVEEINLFAENSQRRIVIHGETGTIEIRTSADDGLINVSEAA
ncbi:MAG TPA: hypothetical protein VNG71_07870 [Pyrinomonadaceae bacterium]|nr:hypothetical protein [Pyrinomonadaceae bacterium]